MSLVLLRHLIPDLANMVLEYCWMETDYLPNLCIYGNYEKVSAMKKENLNHGFRGACYGGYIKIVNLLIKFSNIEETMESGAYSINKCSLNWHNGLDHACLGGHMDIVKLIASNIDDYVEIAYIHYSTIYTSICISGNMQILEYMTKHLHRNNAYSYWGRGLEICCKNGNMEFVKFMVNDHDTSHYAGAINWNIGLSGACRGEQEEMAKLMIEKGADYCGCFKGNDCLYEKNKIR